MSDKDGEVGNEECSPSNACCLSEVKEIAQDEDKENAEDVTLRSIFPKRAVEECSKLFAFTKPLHDAYGTKECSINGGCRGKECRNGNGNETSIA